MRRDRPNDGEGPLARPFPGSQTELARCDCTIDRMRAFTATIADHLLKACSVLAEVVQQAGHGSHLMQSWLIRRSGSGQFRCQTGNVGQVLRQRLPLASELMLPQPCWVRMRPKFPVSARRENHSISLRVMPKSWHRPMTSPHASARNASANGKSTTDGGRDVHLTFNPYQFATCYTQRWSLNGGNRPLSPAFSTTTSPATAS